MGVPSTSNVSVGQPKAGGGIFAAPAGTAIPADAAAPLPAEFVGLGYVSDAGLVNTVATESNAVVAWGGDQVLNARTSRTETFKFSFIETNENTMKQVYGAQNVSTGDKGLTVLHNSKSATASVYVFEILLGDKRAKRIVLGNAQVTELGDVSYLDGAAVGYEVTLTAFPDKNGNTAIEYIASIA
ncbi:MAG: phage tail protein [Renibacterium sp.]|jgi:hypothetical protein|nr:phage tail protein [Renibacterium sp.]